MKFSHCHLLAILKTQVLQKRVHQTSNQLIQILAMTLVAMQPRKRMIVINVSRERELHWNMYSSRQMEVELQAQSLCKIHITRSAYLSDTPLTSGKNSKTRQLSGWRLLREVQWIDSTSVFITKSHLQRHS